MTVSWLDLPGLLNARDVAASCRQPQLLRGSLIRSASPHELSAEDGQRLADQLGLRLVIDLRSARERSLCPVGPWLDVAGVRLAHRSLTPEALELRDGLPWEFMERLGRDRTRVGEGYLRFLEDRPDSILGALRDLYGADRQKTLVHCSAGKDRTGVLVAIILAALDVPDEAILVDFAASNQQLEGLLDQQRRTTYGHQYVGRSVQDYKVHPEAISGLLAHLRYGFGTVRNWLSSIGWCDEDQARLVSTLVRM